MMFQYAYAGDQSDTDERDAKDTEGACVRSNAQNRRDPRERSLSGSGGDLSPPSRWLTSFPTTPPPGNDYGITHDWYTTYWTEMSTSNLASLQGDGADVVNVNNLG